MPKVQRVRDHAFPRFGKNTGHNFIPPTFISYQMHQLHCDSNPPPYDLWSCISFFYFCNAILGQPCSLGYSVYNQIHDSIKATTKSNKVTSNSTPKARECESLRTACRNTLDPKLSQRIDKNAIIANYDKNCQKAGCPGQVTTVKKVSRLNFLPPTLPYTNSCATARWSQAWTINTWFPMSYSTMLSSSSSSTPSLSWQTKMLQTYPK